MARRRCLYRGCLALITSGSYCAVHKPYGAGWAATRARVLDRDGHRCKCDGCLHCQGSVYALPYEMLCSRRATTVDHINGMAQDNRPENLRAMCRPCNTVKGGL